jgi:hypothetical protein
MNKHQANQLLNEVREGILYPQSVIIKALVTTGDIYAKCPNLESHIPIGNDDSDSPNHLYADLQNTQGEQINNKHLTSSNSLCL